MPRSALTSKIHWASVGGCRAGYAGSLAIGPNFLRVADDLKREKVAGARVDSAARFKTRAIAGSRGGGQMQVSGARGRVVRGGEPVVVSSCAERAAPGLVECSPRVVHVGARGLLVTLDDQVAHPAARRS